ncbi:ABC transporter permease [Paenibacillus sp. 7124]|uniref:ABC transporter permease n=1 Tax=Paenibacillus apii TaxID=1850370 RepID=A0A6M1PJE1_9BACL|nr:ABC transporter permease [Paenibacillus apii]NGM82445.1 ABC transporter permease [Paenibacillus apii]
MKYLVSNWERVVELFFQHLFLISVSLVIALAISIPIGVIISKVKVLYNPVVGLLGIIYTIPSMALFALLIPLVGLGTRSAIFALVMYAQMILVRNVVAALEGISPAIFEAAKGMGMGRWRIFWKIEMPLAMPVIIAGIRITVVSLIGIGAIAAYINAGGLGLLIFEGINQFNPQKVIAGTVAITLLAIVTDQLLQLLQKKVMRSA